MCRYATIALIERSMDNAVIKAGTSEWDFNVK
jgi:hypothetical protein